ncbi:MAG TPA: immunity 22 family protein [Armatimonadaceae bacterium]|nr:immunity 22 family protein [Armatimonadaceae bacterium]
MRDPRQVQVWAGRFPSRACLDAYFEEVYDAGDGEEEATPPISAFAAGQGERFYDHDALEVSFSPGPAADLRPLLEAHSFSTSYVDAVTSAVQSSGMRDANTLVLFFGVGLEHPRSVSEEGVALDYLGAFDCDPAAESVEARRLREAGIPATVRLEIQSAGHARFQGEAVRAVVIGSRGLVIGRGGIDGDGDAATRDVPYLDVAALADADAVAAVQVRIYRDPFDQWVVEDLGRNGLTSIGGTVLRGERSMPWHEDRLGVGAVTFRWNGFPDGEPA